VPEGSQPTLEPNVEPIEIQEEVERSFLDYAMSVIVSRALPDARDGLKPVHRRIIYGMYDRGQRPDRQRSKSAQVVGHVMGNFHPHGDQAIYDALARMAQDFSLRHPLVDGKGNFGSPDPNDRPGAMRYTECRLAPIAMQMLEGIDENTVDFGDTYDGKTQEPLVLPARFPNLLVNGGGGIAVGMATNIPPHNLGEIIDATVHLIDNPDAVVEDLMKIVKGPDFPTGALILGRSGIHDALTTGRGSIKMRAVAEIDEHKNGQRIVVTDVPYQTSVEAIGTKIADLVSERKLEGIRDVRNETSRGEYRLVIDLKRDANAQVVLNQLYKHTPMQTSFGVNMLALVDGVPKVLNLKEALEHYIAHQVEVITRRTQFRLDKARDRAHIVEGLLRALDAIDEIIALIRGSESADAARSGLMAKPYEFSEIQANHILDMQLRRLAQLEHQKLKDEYEELAATIKELESILASDSKLRGVIKDEIGEVREKFADERRTQITFDSGNLEDLDLIEDEEVVVVLSHKGYVKTVAADAFRKQGRGGKGVRGSSLKDEDYVEHLLTSTAHSYLLFFSNRGRVYRLRAHEIPMKERTARGTALVNLIALAPEERIQAIIDTRTYEDGAYLFFATKRGQVKKTRMSEYDSSLRTGLIAINLKPDDELVRVIQTNGESDIFMVSRNGMTIRFSEADVRAMGRAAAGVRGMKLKNAEDAVVSCDVARDDSVMLFVSASGHGKRTKLDKFNRQGRGGQGVRGMKITASRVGIVAAFMVDPTDEILVFSSAGNIIRTGVMDISSQGRDATGVKVAALRDKESVVAVARVLEAEEEGEGT
jgi:DNA gyrase subunit A